MCDAMSINFRKKLNLFLEFRKIWMSTGFMKVRQSFFLMVNFINLLIFAHACMCDWKRAFADEFLKVLLAPLFLYQVSDDSKVSISWFIILHCFFVTYYVHTWVQLTHFSLFDKQFSLNCLVRVFCCKYVAVKREEKKECK